MKIFVSVKYFYCRWIAIGSQWDILNTVDRNQITMGYSCYSDVYQRIAIGYPEYYRQQSDRNRIS